MPVPWKRDDSHNSRAGHPRWRRCSSVEYAQYSSSSRLASGAPRSGTYASHHVSRGLDGLDRRAFLACAGGLATATLTPAGAQTPDAKPPGAKTRLILLGTGG